MLCRSKAGTPFSLAVSQPRPDGSRFQTVVGAQVVTLASDGTVQVTAPTQPGSLALFVIATPPLLVGGPIVVTTRSVMLTVTVDP